MLRNTKSPIKIFICAFALAFAHCSAQAAPTWHCSKSDVQVADASDNFTLASLPLSREVIRISLRDLYEAYQGAEVTMSGGQKLTACVATEDLALTVAAMTSIGSPLVTNKALANDWRTRFYSVHAVKNESDMQSCIVKNHPAIGYLSRPTHLEALGPCF
jgi:hypothetical protein